MQDERPDNITSTHAPPVAIDGAAYRARLIAEGRLRPGVGDAHGINQTTTPATVRLDDIGRAVAATRVANGGWDDTLRQPQRRRST